MAHTKYDHLTDRELLVLVDDAAGYSPIIASLVNRVNRNLKDKAEEDSALHFVDCPICEATVRADFDESKNRFTLEKE